MLKWLQRQVCFSFQHISLSFSGSCDHSGSGTRECTFILRMRHPILPNTKRPFWSGWTMNTVPNIDMCRSINMIAYWVAITFPPQRHQDPVNRPSAKCRSVRKPHPSLPDTPVDLTSASKYFQMLPGPPGAKQSALRLCKSILRCSWRQLQLWRCIQDATSFEL